MSETDEQLMARYCAGDTVAFDRLYARYRGPLYRYVERLSGGVGDTESLYQDAWMRVIHGRHHWRQDQPFRPWLFRIAHNRVVDQIRREAGHVSEALDPDGHAQDRHSTEALQFLRDCVQRLLALLGHLPEVQRSTFLLKEEAGLSLAEIGDVTGVERETVKSRLRYALSRLRRGLEGCDE